MLARLVRELPAGGDYVFEPKWDGFWAGPQGPKGDTGAPGSAVAYARVGADGSISQSKNVDRVYRVSPFPGYYCIRARSR